MVTDERSNLEKLLDKQGITEKEAITAIKSGAGFNPGKVERLGISGRHFKYGYFSDSHIGHKEFKPELFDKMKRMFDKESIDFIISIGDTLEGMSGRDGHVYELTHIGFNQQINYAAGLLNQLKQPIYGIDGNHDGWYKIKGNGGVVVGEELQNRVKNYTHIGEMEGIIKPVKNVEMKLFHANDGSAYATSYKLQKLVESFSGGEKPHIVHSGHYHKALYAFIRNVHGFESGTLCGQTPFMRGKKIQAHMGFGIVDVYHNKDGVDRIIHEFIPGYEK